MHQPAPATAKTAMFSRVYLGSPDQIRAVRGDLRGLLDGCPIADDAILCASEMAANAVLHSHSALPGGQFTVRAELSPGGYVWIEVEDQGGHWSPAVAESGGGHGLDIIHALATGWGIDGDYRTRTIGCVSTGHQTHNRPRTPQQAPAAASQHAKAENRLQPAPAPRPVLASARTTRPAQRWTAALDGQRLRQLRRLHGLSQESSPPGRG